MVYKRDPEHEAFYDEEMNILERIHAGISSTDDFLRLTNILMKRQNDLLKIIAGGVDGQTQQPAINLNIKVGIKTVNLIRDNASRNTEVIKPSSLVDCQQAMRILILVNNSFNQQVEVDVLGNDGSSPESALEIHTFTVAATDRGAYGLRFQDWMPYVGLQVTPASAPTAGKLNAVAILQQQET